MKAPSGWSIFNEYLQQPSNVLQIENSSGKMRLNASSGCPNFYYSLTDIDEIPGKSVAENSESHSANQFENDYSCSEPSTSEENDLENVPPARAISLRCVKKPVSIFNQSRIFSKINRQNCAQSAMYDQMRISDCPRRSARNCQTLAGLCMLDTCGLCQPTIGSEEPTTPEAKMDLQHYGGVPGQASVPSETLA